MSEQHDLKVWPAYFRHLASGNKTFEIRLNDRAYQPGDILYLREYDPNRCLIGSTVRPCVHDFCEADKYTGSTVRRRVGYVASGRMFGLDLGEHVVLSLLPTDEACPMAPSGLGASPHAPTRPAPDLARHTPEAGR